MLNLQPCIHLDEEHILAIGNELDGAGAYIADGSSGLARSGAYGLTLSAVKRWRRCFLDHLLMPPLQSAFALEQRQQVAVTISDHLHLNVARVLDEFFDQHAIVAKSSLGLALGADNGGCELIR